MFDVGRNFLPGLLTYTELEDEIEAFKYAIDVINENSTLLSQTQLKAVVAKMGSIEDSPSNIVRNGERLVQPLSSIIA
jgi:hypothetical protein